jgi:protein-tyrosine phosphatase
MNVSVVTQVAFAVLAFVAVPAAARIAPPQPPTASSHQRVLPLQGGQNFRDLGGYRTQDGRTVRWGLLYRSGSMHFLTAADFAYLDKLGIKVVCDFRDNRERAAEPVDWPQGQAPRILSDDYRLDAGGTAKARPAPPTTGEQARAMLAAMYPHNLEQFNDQYRRMFAELLAGHAPLAFNCTAGKDRTGVAAALLLTALGVPRATIVEDYTLSNRYYDPTKVDPHADTSIQLWKALPPDVVKAYSSADPSYIEAVFRVMDAHPGGAMGYLQDRLGLSPADIRSLRAMYTE